MPRNRRVAQSVAPTEEKDKIISAEYHDVTEGFRGINETFKAVKQYGISMKYLRGWYDRNVEKNTLEGKGKNSYVAPHTRYEYQADIFEITDKQFVNQTYKYGLSVIDIFSKKAAVVPLKTKDERAWIAGLTKAFAELDGKPQILMTDQDGALQKEFIKFMLLKKIKWIVTRTHAHFVERFHRTFRGMLHKRLAHLMKGGEFKSLKFGNNLVTDAQWHAMIPYIIDTYNDTVHSVTKFKPNDAVEADNSTDVKANIELKARFNRKYPPIHVGDMVRIVRKKKLGEKEHTGRFLQSIHKVERIGTGRNKLYFVEGHKLPLLRADIALHKLKVPLFRNRAIDEEDEEDNDDSD